MLKVKLNLNILENFGKVIAPNKRKMKCLRKFQRIKIKSFEIMTKISKTSNKSIKV